MGVCDFLTSVPVNHGSNARVGRNLEIKIVKWVVVQGGTF